MSQQQRHSWCRGRPGVLVLGLLCVAVSFVGTSTVRAQVHDRVQEFREALKVDRDTTTKEAIDFRAETLKKAADKVTDLGDLAEILILPDWMPNADAESLRIITNRFETMLHQELSLDKSTPTRQAAAAILIKETVAKTRKNKGLRTPPLNFALANVAAELVALVKAPKSPDEVRIAALSALGLVEPVIVKQPVGTANEIAKSLAQWINPQIGTVPATIKEQLLSAPNPAVRLAAVQALPDFVQGSMLFASYHPAPTVNDERTKPEKARSDAAEAYRIESFINVMSAAMAGLKDASPVIRRASMDVFKDVMNRVAFDLIRGPFDATSEKFPPPGRKEWTPAETERVQLRRREVDALSAMLAPLFKAIDAAIPGIATASSADPDADVRVDANQVLERIGRARLNLTRLKDSIPRRPGAEKSEARLNPTVVPLPALGPGPVIPPLAVPPVRAAKDATVAVGHAVAYVADAGPTEKLEASLEAKIGALQKNLRDPDLRVRQAALDAVEVMGPDAAPARAALIGAIANPTSDRFIRWQAARILGKLAPRNGEAVSEKDKDLIRATVVELAALTDNDRSLDVRLAASTALEHYGPLAAPAVAALGTASAQGDAEPRIAAMRALQSIGVPAARSLRELAVSLRDPNFRVRQAACDTIGQIGALALAAETDPAKRTKWIAQITDWMKPLLTDQAPEVCRAAADAILRVRGK